MFAIRTILHPTDFSEQSEYALRLACALARDHGAHLIVLHVAPPPVIASAEGVFHSEPEYCLEPLREQLHQLQTPDVGRVDRRVEEGEPEDEILRVAQESNADLIVMGTHGRTGLDRLLLGSVAEQVVRQASCPVMTVKTPIPAAAASPVQAVAEPAFV